MELANNFTFENNYSESDFVHNSNSIEQSPRALDSNTLISLCAILWGYALYVFLCPRPNCKCMTMLTGKVVLITGKIF